MAGNLFGRFDVDNQGVFFLRVLFVDSVAAVDVDDVHGLGVLNNKVDTVSDGDRLAEESLDLARDTEIVEDRVFPLVKFDDFGLLRRDGLDVALDVFVKSLVVHMDVVERLVEQVAEHDCGLVLLANHTA